MPKALWPVILCLRDVQSGRTHRDGTRVAGDGGTGARVWGLLWGKETFWNETEVTVPDSRGWPGGTAPLCHSACGPWTQGSRGARDGENTVAAK